MTTIGTEILANVELPRVVIFAAACLLLAEKPHVMARRF